MAKHEASVSSMNKIVKSDVARTRASVIRRLSLLKANCVLRCH